MLGDGPTFTLIGALSWGTSNTCEEPVEGAADYFASLLDPDNADWVATELADCAR